MVQNQEIAVKNKKRKKKAHFYKIAWPCKHFDHRVHEQSWFQKHLWGLNFNSRLIHCPLFLCEAFKALLDFKGGSRSRAETCVNTGQSKETSCIEREGNKVSPAGDVVCDSSCFQRQREPMQTQCCSYVVWDLMISFLWFAYDWARKSELPWCSDLKQTGKCHPQHSSPISAWFSFTSYYGIACSSRAISTHNKSDSIGCHCKWQTLQYIWDFISQIVWSLTPWYFWYYASKLVSHLFSIIQLLDFFTNVILQPNIV